MKFVHGAKFISFEMFLVKKTQNWLTKNMATENVSENLKSEFFTFTEWSQKKYLLGLAIANFSLLVNERNILK